MVVFFRRAVSVIPSRSLSLSQAKGSRTRLRHSRSTWPYREMSVTWRGLEFARRQALRTAPTECHSFGKLRRGSEAQPKNLACERHLSYATMRLSNSTARCFALLSMTVHIYLVPHLRIYSFTHLLIHSSTHSRLHFCRDLSGRR